MKNVVLIGFMGTGKTSIGRLLATRLGCAFHDLDRKIEEQHGMSIPAMFAQHGEPYFRAREKEAGRGNTAVSYTHLRAHETLSVRGVRRVVV